MVEQTKTMGSQTIPLDLENGKALIKWGNRTINVIFKWFLRDQYNYIWSKICEKRKTDIVLFFRRHHVDWNCPDGLSCRPMSWRIGVRQVTKKDTFLFIQMVKSQHLNVFFDFQGCSNCCYVRSWSTSSRLSWTGLFVLCLFSRWFLLLVTLLFAFFLCISILV